MWHLNLLLHFKHCTVLLMLLSPSPHYGHGHIWAYEAALRIDIWIYNMHVKEIYLHIGLCQILPSLPCIFCFLADSSSWKSHTESLFQHLSCKNLSAGDARMKPGIFHMQSTCSTKPWAMVLKIVHDTKLKCIGKSAISKLRFKKANVLKWSDNNISPPPLCDLFCLFEFALKMVLFYLFKSLAQKYLFLSATHKELKLPR